MSTLKDILDIGLKYGPEAANYFTGQRRLKEQRKNQREEMFPEFQRKNLSASQQALSNRANDNPNAAAINDLEAATTGALNISGNTKGGRGMLADILRGSANARAKIETSGDAITNSRLQGAGANEASVMDYNRNLSDKEKIYDVHNRRQLDYLGDQEKRLKGKAAGSMFDMASDISNLFPKNKTTEDGGDVNDLLDILNTAEGPVDKTQEDQPNDVFNVQSDRAERGLPPAMIDPNQRRPSLLDQLGFENEFNPVELEDGGAVVTPDGYDHDGVDILMTDRSNGQPLGTVESAEMIVNASDTKKGIALAKKNPKSPTSKWFLQLAKRFEKEAKNRK
jgi:hypothetical protein